MSRSPATSGIARLRGPLLRILAGAAMLMAVTVAIGRPTVFTDTDDYYAEGHSIVQALTVWARGGRPPILLSEVHDRLTDPADADEEPVHNQDGARSPYYGLFLYLTHLFGSLWLTAFVQALLAAALIHALWRAMAPRAARWTWFALMGLLALGSSLPVFTGFAMPDVFAGFAALSTVLLVIYGERLRRWGKLALWLVLAASLNFHSSNLATCALLTLAALAVLAWRRVGVRPIVFRGALVLAAAVAALAAASVYGVAVKLRTGDELGRPPFLMARVLADGPGRSYLRRACAAGAPYTLCAYRNLPLTDSEDILWSDEPKLGIFNIASFQTRVKLEHEEKRFVLAAVASDPLGQVSASLRNFAGQLVDTKLEDPLKNPGYYLLDPYWKTTNLPGLILRTLPCQPRHGGCKVRAPEAALDWEEGLVAIAAALYLAWRMFRDGPALLRTDPGVLRDEVRRTAYAAALLLVVAVVANAAVCGMLSGVFPRYQARILWLLPAAAALLEIARRQPRAAPDA